jgi:hypothetical protein
MVERCALFPIADLQRGLEALEAEEHEKRQDEENARFEKERLDEARSFIMEIVLAFYLGGLKPGEPPIRAYARALNYGSEEEYINVVDKCRQAYDDIELSRDPIEANPAYGDLVDFATRRREAELRLYAQVGINAEHAPADVLTNAFIQLANQLPEQWLRYIKSELDDDYIMVGPGTPIPIIFPWEPMRVPGRFA